MGEPSPPRFFVQPAADREPENEDDGNENGRLYGLIEIDRATDSCENDSRDADDNERDAEGGDPPRPADPPSNDLASPRPNIVAPQPRHHGPAYRWAITAEVDENPWSLALFHERGRAEMIHVKAYAPTKNAING